ncbi:ankyrin repeat-containing protein [Anaeramoeba flamelloides]|uniref:Ankyrin repeat-containing protein n=1 Tax=Anaeramoeba flamelloides TaxID=1746091 RepID=A0ABQ8Z728_9EUKA|nr:ankyrin repeat-containing protein [Anaeramoeba flamelloides]
MRHSSDWSKLHIKARDNDFNGLEDLLKKGIDPNTTKSDNWTPLHLACLNDNLESIEVLIKYGSDLSLKENNGRKALHVALHSGNVCIRNILNHSKIPELFEALKKNDDCELIKKNSLNELKKIKYETLNILHFACIYNKPAVLHELLQMGMDPNEKCIYKQTGLHLSAIYNHHSCSNILIAYKAKMNVCNIKNETPLLISAKYGYRYNAEYLLSCGADPLIKNHVQLTPLHYAVFRDNYKCVEILLSTKRGRKELHYQKRNLVHLAVKGKSIHSLKILEKYKCNFEMLNDYGETPFQVALKNNSLKIISWFLKLKKCSFYKKKQTNAIHLSVLQKKMPVLEILLKSKRIPIDAKDENGNTAIFYSVQQESINFTRALLKYGAKPRIVNNMGSSPFDVANEQNLKLITLFKKLHPQRINVIEHLSSSSTSITITWLIPKSFEKIENFKIKAKSIHQCQHLVSNDNWCQINFLMPNVEYSIKIKAFNYFGSGKYSKPKSISTRDSKKPSQITNLTQIDPVKDSEIFIKWDQPKYNGDPIIEYEIQVNGIKTSFEELFFSTSNNTSFRIFGLPENNAFFVKMRSKNKLGWSHWSYEAIMLTKKNEN